MERTNQPCSKRKLSYYFETLKSDRTAVNIDVLESPAKKNTTGNKRSHVSFGCPRDSDWQRRMDGFSGLEIDCMDQKCVKTFAAKKKQVITADGHSSPDTQQCIEDWHSSDGEDAIHVTHKYARRRHSVHHSIRSVKRYQHQINDVDIVHGNSDYGAEEGDRTEDENDNFVSEESLSPVISVCRSQSPEPEISTCKKSKASDWVKDICWKEATPEKVIDKNVALEDSSKKKRQKYVKDGLAESLHRLIQQQKSLQTFRTHKFKSALTKQSPDNTKAMTIELNRVQIGPSLVIATCNILSKPETSTTLSAGEHLVAMFTESTWMQYNLAPNIKMRIYPPWQILRQQSRGKVLLCTSHLEVLDRPQNITQDISCQPEDIIRTIARWICPCSEDDDMDHSHCPAHKQPVDLKQAIAASQKLPISNHKPDEDVTTIEQTMLESSTLMQSTCSPTTSRMTHSILEAIEISGGGIVKGVNFVATVQRIFTKETRNPNNSFTSRGSKLINNTSTHSLLLQDFCGFLSELMLPAGSENKQPWDTVLHGGEGKTYEFRGLRVSHRTNRNKSARLFSLIDSVWKASSVVENPPASQDSQQSDLQPAHPPSFCYILQAPHGETSCLQQMTITTSVYSPRTTQAMCDIMALHTHDQATRVSMQGRIIFEKTQELTRPSSVQQKIIYVISRTAEDGCLPISFSPSLYSKIIDSTKILLLRDVLINQGNYSLDEYSLVSVMDPVSILPVQDIISRLQRFTIPVKPNTLYAAEGIVCGINEDTAYSWLACDQCDNDKLQGGTAKQPFLYCPLCKRGVPQPVSRMNLEIIITIPEFDNYTVQIRLLQHTIENILPQESADEEGYDVQSVLNKPVGPIPVVVITHVNNILALEEIKL